MSDYLTTTKPCTESVRRAFTEALRAFIGRRVDDPAAQRRVASETFAHVQRELSGLRSGERVGAWLYQVARVHVAEHLRAESAGDLLFAAAAPPPEDEEQVRAELTTLIEACADALPDTYREALVLAELEGLPQPEVARRLGLSLTSAKARMQRGQQRMQELLDACCARELATAR
jgi:RNA polymerase sigma-70 factor (ECF subfamily)